MLMFILKDDLLQEAEEVIKKVIGDINKPETAVMFTVPIDFAEGLGE